MSKSPLPSNRSFGLLFALVFALIGAYGLWRGRSFQMWWLGLSGGTLVVVLVNPALLAPLNRAWMRLGEILNKIVSPIVLAVMFYGVFVPTGIVMRLVGRDPMTRRFDPRARTYWKERSPPGPDPSGLPNQF